MTRIALILFGLALIGAGIVGLVPAPVPTGSLIVSRTSEPIALPTEAPTQTPVVIERIVVVTATTDPEPTRTPLPKFDLWSAQNVKVQIGEVVIEFNPVHYTPAFDTDFETPNGALWTDNNRNTGVWLHSGPNSAATPLQMAVELDELGNRRSLFEVNKVIDQLPGQPALVTVDGVTFNMVVRKVGRFPAWDVPFLEENYMSVDEIIGGEPVEGGLILWHCVRAAAGDEIGNNIRVEVGGETYSDGWSFGRLVWVLGG
jgi:hypothetical protein